MPRQPKKQRSVPIHIHGNAAHNAGIYAAIGGLVVSWANNESVFLAMLQALTGGGSLTAAIIWQSQSTSRPRLNLVSRLAREQIKDEKLIADIESAVQRFNGMSRTRNYFCHAMYEYRLSDGAIMSAHAMSLSDTGHPIRAEDKKFNAATINELNDTTMRLSLLNRELWDLVIRVQNALGVQRVQMPQWPGADQSRPIVHPPIETGEEPLELPPTSEG